MIKKMIMLSVMVLAFGVSDLQAQSYNCCTKSSSDVYVGGYTKSDGKYVAPHYRSAPDRSTNNNFSTKGNYNPYTGKTGTKKSNTRRYSY